MKIEIRKAEIEDAPHFIIIKDQLSFKNVEGETTRGGFLLGTDLSVYEHFILNDFCLVAELNKEIIGFGIVLKDDSVRKSEIWTKRHFAHWEIDIEPLASEKVCYFEQLAFLAGYSRTVFRLGCELLNLAFKNHSVLLTTTVHSPILNLAAVPYILKAGGSIIGKIDEIYPQIGAIKSDIYKIDRAVYFKNKAQPKWVNFFQRNENGHS